MAENVVPHPFVAIREPAVSAGGGVPVVLLHGWASSSAYWDPLAEKLLAAGMNVWVVDLPGYHPGEILPVGFEWTLDSAAAALAAALEARHSGQVHVVGHSLGGSVALTLAANHPELVATLALVGMVPAPPNEGFRSMLESQWKQGFIDPETKSRCMEAWYGHLSPEDEELLGRGFNVPFEVLGSSGKAAMTGVEPSVPGRVHAPVLVLAGTADRLRTLDQMAAFVKADPRRRLAPIPEAGHSVHWEQPGQCAEALREFWSTSWPAPA
ncbi:alpha/beta fold hydrolase [Paenarthrobacter nitroguajacolicus]|uniref:alpha/beta fold hydrolase n=1 Tax=Paenarthrobacter nitroguajacolicus TaxID=211146 RepID=UPI00248CFF41|nr:alpha/beta hydrolase [Paenarthrobacter nitroguajacolicus]MDI2036007.1 2-hydroxy-6-oxononadienedioate/2-hydroxy-6-oxononatrienedioate hydrolase [Paenarthrobacter nitroguajacolicus]